MFCFRYISVNTLHKQDTVAVIKEQESQLHHRIRYSLRSQARCTKITAQNQGHVPQTHGYKKFNKCKLKCRGRNDSSSNGHHQVSLERNGINSQIYKATWLIYRPLFRQRLPFIWGGDKRTCSQMDDKNSKYMYFKPPAKGKHVP
jgi:predicted transcriptional regulator